MRINKKSISFLRNLKEEKENQKIIIKILQKPIILTFD